MGVADKILHQADRESVAAPLSFPAERQFCPTLHICRRGEGDLPANRVKDDVQSPRFALPVARVLPGTNTSPKSLAKPAQRLSAESPNI
jgi:hypothetical protein